MLIVIYNKNIIWNILPTVFIISSGETTVLHIYIPFISVLGSTAANFELNMFIKYTIEQGSAITIKFYFNTYYSGCHLQLDEFYL